MRKKANQGTKLLDFNELYNALAVLLHDSRKTLINGKLDPSRAGELADYVVVIRSLLKQLNTLPLPIENKDLASSINSLREDYLELEGMVKEIRNDTAGPRGRDV